MSGTDRYKSDGVTPGELVARATAIGQSDKPGYVCLPGRVANREGSLLCVETNKAPIFNDRCRLVSIVPVCDASQLS